MISRQKERCNSEQAHTFRNHIQEGRIDHLPARSRSDDVRLALLLTYITIGWMTIEGAAALLLGWASRSLLLECCSGD